MESGTFRFCGREVIQHSGFSVSIRCKDTTEKIEPVRHDPKRRKQLDLARDHEKAQLKSVVGSLAWVAKQCRPQLSHKLFQETVESSDDRLFSKSGMLTWNKMEMLAITDASFGNDSNFRSRKGPMTFLTGSVSFYKNGMRMHVIGYSSMRIGRFCRTTLQTKTYALSDGVEESMQLRAALADAHGVFLLADWEYHSARYMHNVWMIDCNSLNDHLRSNER